METHALQMHWRKTARGKRTCYRHTVLTNVFSLYMEWRSLFWNGARVPINKGVLQGPSTSPARILIATVRIVKRRHQRRPDRETPTNIGPRVWTHWDREKMVAIFKFIFNKKCCILTETTIYTLRKVEMTCSEGSHLATITGSDNDFASDRRQVIIWTNNGLVWGLIYASIGLIVIIETTIWSGDFREYTTIIFYNTSLLTR